MAELDDYRGPFKSDATLSDFSKKFLIGYRRELVASYLKLDELWWQAVNEMYGNQVAEKLESIVWIGIANKVLPKIARFIGVELPVKDMYEWAKVWQLMPDGYLPPYPDDPGLFPSSVEIIDDHHATVTCHNCAILSWIEKKAPDPGQRMQSLCGTIEEKMVQAYAAALNPNIKARATLLPPRKSPTDTACKWEFKMER